jgi:hypothetical protein
MGGSLLGAEESGGGSLTGNNSCNQKKASSRNLARFFFASLLIKAIIPIAFINKAFCLFFALYKSK